MSEYNLYFVCVVGIWWCHNTFFVVTVIDCGIWWCYLLSGYSGLYCKVSVVGQFGVVMGSLVNSEL